MNRYIEKLKSFLALQGPCFGYGDANSILEMLYYYYIDENRIDSAVIRCQFKDLGDILDRLPFEDNNAVFSKTVDLCIAHGRQAFLEGVQIGMQLFTELEELNQHTCPRLQV